MFKQEDFVASFFGGGDFFLWGLLRELSAFPFL